MSKLDEMRAKLAALESKKQPSNNNNQSGGLTYPHWNIEEGTTATVRFLPDGNQDNPFFWVERAMIKLPFAGVKGGDSKDTIVQVPCMEMYGEGESCSVLNEVRTWFKDPAMEEMGRKYWKKRSYIFHGFVHDDPMNEENKPENPIRKFMISPSIFNTIKASLMDPEMEDLPTSYENGLDFRIAKTQKGMYADYGTSTWARKETALTADELAAIEQYGLNNLTDFLPPKPDAETQKVIYEMFEASVNGEQYDVEKWGNYYRPWGVDAPEGSNTTTETVTPVATPAPVTEAAPFEAETTTATTAPAEEAAAPTVNDKTADILAQIRARQQA